MRGKKGTRISFHSTSKIIPGADTLVKGYMSIHGGDILCSSPGGVQKITIKKDSGLLERGQVPPNTQGKWDVSLRNTVFRIFELCFFK